MTGVIKISQQKPPKTYTCAESIRIVKKCPVCGWRILDKVTPTTGVIEMKCPNCRRIVEVDLSYRLKNK
jgi:DNA-directed RNA polymerase subunit RPC12/RpoP